MCKTKHQRRGDGLVEVFVFLTVLLLILFAIRHFGDDESCETGEDRIIEFHSNSSIFLIPRDKGVNFDGISPEIKYSQDDSDPWWVIRIGDSCWLIQEKTLEKALRVVQDESVIRTWPDLHIEPVERRE